MIKIYMEVHNKVTPVRKREVFYRTCRLCTNVDEVGTKPKYSNYRVESEGYPFEVNGYTMYVSKSFDSGDWDVTEAKTGAIVICGHKTKKEAVMLLEHINIAGFKKIDFDEAERQKNEYPIVTQKEYEEIRKESGNA